MSSAHTLQQLGSLLLLCFLFSLPKQNIATLEAKALELLAVEHENPKCFAEGVQDLTCFWEEENGGTIDQYKFMYTYEYTTENNRECALIEQPAGGNKTWYICQLTRVQLFVPFHVHVTRVGRLIYNRSLLIDHVFLLDPPTNVTVARTGQQGQLRVSWQPPLTPLMYMENNLIYEVKYAIVGSRMGKIELVRGGRVLLLHSLQPDTSYDVRVRVKPDGLSYSGYWSVWAPPVFMTTPPADLDLLLLVLCLIISLILVCLSLALILSHRRSLLKKLWPVVPSPENKFLGLFAVYGGDFRVWVGNGDQWCRPAFLFMGENLSPLEVLSEARHTCSVPVHSAPPDLPAGNEENEEVKERWRLQPHQQWLLERLQATQQQPALCCMDSLLEPSDAYVSLDQNSPCVDRSNSKPPDDISEESCPLQVLFSIPQTPSSCSELCSTRHSSGSTAVSSLSSLEYPQGAWPFKEPSYTCGTLTDSGVSVDYSPMGYATTRLTGTHRIYANAYKNEFPVFTLPCTGQTV